MDTLTIVILALTILASLLAAFLAVRGRHTGDVNWKVNSAIAIFSLAAAVLSVMQSFIGASEQQQLEARMNDARIEAANAKEASRRLEEVQKPREFTAGQRDHLSKSLESVARGRILVYAVNGEPGAWEFANTLADFLRDLKFNVGPATLSILSSDPKGLRLVINPADRGLPMAVALQQAFSSVGMPLLGYQDERIERGTVQIHVSGRSMEAMTTSIETAKDVAYGVKGRSN